MNIFPIDNFVDDTRRERVRLVSVIISYFYDGDYLSIVEALLALGGKARESDIAEKSCFSQADVEKVCSTLQKDHWLQRSSLYDSVLDLMEGPITTGQKRQRNPRRRRRHKRDCFWKIDLDLFTRCSRHKLNGTLKKFNTAKKFLFDRSTIMESDPIELDEEDEQPIPNIPETQHIFQQLRSAEEESVRAMKTRLSSNPNLHNLHNLKEQLLNDMKKN